MIAPFELLDLRVQFLIVSSKSKAEASKSLVLRGRPRLGLPARPLSVRSYVDASTSKQVLGAGAWGKTISDHELP
jgi:hypothetical protein